MKRLLAWMLGCAVLPGFAQSWPSKPIHLIVASSAGGGSDTIARMYATRLGEALGQPVVIENLGGGGGNLAIGTVARAAPDGYTLLASPGAFIEISPSLHTLTVDVAKELQPVTPVAQTKPLLVVRPGLPVHSVAELIAYGKSHPGKLNFGTGGNGDTAHIGAVMLMRAGAFQATPVPYKGGAQALTGLLGGQVDFTFDSGVAIPSIRNGKLRLIAVVGSQRSALFPETPTLAEAGMDIDVTTPQGLYAPARTAPDIVERLNREVSRIMHEPQAVSALATLGAEPVPAVSPAEFAARLDRDRARFGAIVREAHIATN